MATVDDLLVVIRGDVANLRRALDDAGRSVDGFHNTTRTKLTAIDKQLAGAAGMVKGAVVGMATAWASSKLNEAIDGTGKALQDIARKAENLGINTDSLQVFTNAFEDAGVSTETFEKGLSKLTKAIGEDRAGLGGLTHSLRNLNPELLTQLRTVETSEAAFLAVSDAIAKEEDVTRRAAIATAVFGKSGVELTGVLARGSAGFARLREEMRAAGTIMSGAEIRQGVEIQNRLNEMAEKSEAAWRRVGMQLAPIKIQMLETAASWGDAIADYEAKFRGGLAAVSEKGLQTIIDNAKAKLRDLDTTQGDGASQVMLRLMLGGSGAIARQIDAAKEEIAKAQDELAARKQGVSVEIVKADADISQAKKKLSDLETAFKATTATAREAQDAYVRALGVRIDPDQWTGGDATRLDKMAAQIGDIRAELAQLIVDANRSGVNPARIVELQRQLDALAAVNTKIAKVYREYDEVMERRERAERGGAPDWLLGDDLRIPRLQAASDALHKQQMAIIAAIRAIKTELVEANTIGSQFALGENIEQQAEALRQKQAERARLGWSTRIEPIPEAEQQRMLREHQRSAEAVAQGRETMLGLEQRYKEALHQTAEAARIGADLEVAAMRERAAASGTLTAEEQDRAEKLIRATSAARIGDQMTDRARAIASELAGLDVQILQSQRQLVPALKAQYDIDVANFRDKIRKNEATHAEFVEYVARRTKLLADAQLEIQRERWSQITGVISGSLDQAFGNWIDSGKLSWQDLARTMIADIAKMAFRMQVLQPLFGGSPQAQTGGILGDWLSGKASVWHDGGDTSGAPRQTRVVPAALFANAPRYHDGMWPKPLRAGEFAAILEKGEAVIPRRAMDAARSSSGASRGDASAAAPIVFNIQTPDVQSFQQSQGQIAAQIARAAAAGRRNL